MRASVAVLSVLALPLAACATLADAATGDRDLPSSGVGPFRELRSAEMGLSLVAPNVVDDKSARSRDASILDLDGDPATFEVAGYFAAGEGGVDGAAPVAIRRSVALDGRSFDRQSEVVLEVTEAWEGGTIGAPSAIAVGDEVWLYYAAAGGIGLARSADGVTFEKAPGPVLAVAEDGWDAGAAPRSPSVIALAGGGLAMFYEATIGGVSAIGEARSDGGEAWTRVADGPVLEAGPSGEEAYDDAGVGAPCALAGETSLGRPVMRLYYAAEGSQGKRVIGLAGRFEDGPFERGASAVMGAGSSRAPGEPAAIAFEGVTLLFVTQHRTSSDDSAAIAGGVAPAQAELPPPTPGP